MARRTQILLAGVLVATVIVAVYLATASSGGAASSPPDPTTEAPLASPGGPPRTPTTGTDTCRHPYLPLAVGTRWRYSAASEGAAPAALHVDREVIALERSGGALVATVRSTLSVIGRTDTDSHETRVSCTPGGAVDDVVDDLGEDTMFVPSGTPPTLPRELALGTAFERVADVVLRLPMLGASAARVHIDVRGTSRVVGRERIDTPSGQKEAWILERRDVFTLRPDAAIAAMAEEEGTQLPEMPPRVVRSYLVEGVGMVRREIEQAGHRVDWTLERFSAGR